MRLIDADKPKTHEIQTDGNAPSVAIVCKYWMPCGSCGKTWKPCPCEKAVRLVYGVHDLALIGEGEAMPCEEDEYDEIHRR